LIKDITPERSINFRKTKGSPNKDEQLTMIRHLNRKMEEYQKKINLRKDKLKDKIDHIKYIVEKDINNIS
jgi:argininosuccinate lyase